MEGGGVLNLSYKVRKVIRNCLLIELKKTPTMIDFTFSFSLAH